jgi:hypothetical protein
MGWESDPTDNGMKITCRDDQNDANRARPTLTEIRKTLSELATGSDGATSCGGSASFNVTAHTVTSVSIAPRLPPATEDWQRSPQRQHQRMHAKHGS